jgi:hypothetical protein
MLEGAGELINEIGRVAIAQAPEGWQLIMVRLVCLANSADAEVIVKVPGGEWLELGMVEMKSAYSLRKVMFREGVGTWYRATLTIDSEGQITSYFDYEAKPFEDFEEGEDFIQDLLIEDQRKYSRDQDHPPDWHPAKHLAGGV